MFCLLSTAYCLLLPGCVSPAEREAHRAVQDFYIGDFPSAIARLEPLAKETNENFVLNNCRLGSAALANYDFPLAESAFLNAYEVINSVGVNDGGRSLGAVLVQEKIKIWKGEPFERAMVNFYLGMIYYSRHDYNNARAAFENALFKLRDYGDDKDRKENYREIESDFALASIMLGKCWQRLGRDDLAEANFNHVAQRSPHLRDLADPNRNRDSNVLLVIEYGFGPRKVTEFDGSVIGFAPTPRQQGPIAPVSIVLDNNRIEPGTLGVPPVDLLALAQERRWQSIDTIRTIKSVVGEGLIAAGAVEGIRGAHERGSSQRRDLTAAAALAGAGLLLKASSNPDVRQWEMLPRTVLLLPLHLPPGTHTLTIDFPAIPGLRQTWHNVTVPAQGEITYYFKPLRGNVGPFSFAAPTETIRQ